MTSRSRIAVATAAACALAAATAATVQQTSAQEGSPSAAARPVQERVLTASGSDHLPSWTASDWVTYADHVVVATAAAQQEMRPAKSEIERGEGLIGRRVTMKVDRVLWSRDGAPKPAPSTWRRSSVGWQFTDGDTENRVKMAVEDRPRVETGHSYIIALVWETNPCSGKGGWRGLGEGSLVPYDNATIGAGEMEGHIQSAGQALKAGNGSDAKLEAKMAGRNADSLAKALKAATPAARTFTGPTKADCD